MNPGTRGHVISGQFAHISAASLHAWVPSNWPHTVRVEAETVHLFWRSDETPAGVAPARTVDLARPHQAARPGHTRRVAVTLKPAPRARAGPPSSQGQHRPEAGHHGSGSPRAASPLRSLDQAPSWALRFSGPSRGGVSGFHPGAARGPRPKYLPVSRGMAAAEPPSSRRPRQRRRLRTERRGRAGH